MDWGALGHPAVGVQAVGPELPGTVSLNNITHCLRVDFPSTRCCGLTLVRRSGAAGNEWTCHFCDRPELESFGFATRLCLLKHPGSKSLNSSNDRASSAKLKRTSEAKPGIAATVWQREPIALESRSRHRRRVVHALEVIVGRAGGPMNS